MSSTFFRCQEHVVPAQHIRGYSRATASSEEEQLRLSVKQYTPLNNNNPQPGAVTIIACHAAGFFKEMYEPLFDEMYKASEQDGSTFRIRSIWIADVSSHGASGVLNEGRLGNELCWEDHARDLLGIITAFREQMPLPLVGLGHSMGAVNIIQLALMHPRMFTSIVSIEPPIAKGVDRFDFAETHWILKRHDVWASREDAIRETGKGGVQSSWDPRVRECWANHGFRELPTLLHREAPAKVAEKAKKQKSKPVTMSTTKHHTMQAYCRGAYPPPGQLLQSFEPSRLTHPDISKAEHTELESPMYRPEATMVFRQLPYLRPSCFFLYGAKSTFDSTSAASRADKLNTTGTAIGGSGGAQNGAVEEAVLQDVGHFLPFEKPGLVAEVACQSLAARLDTERSEQAREAQAWAQIGTREKAMVEDDMGWWAREWFSPKSGTKRADGSGGRKVSATSKL